MLQLGLGVRRNHGRHKHVSSRSWVWWSHCRSLLNSGFHSFSVDAHSKRGTSSSLQFAGSRPRHDLMCGRREKPATSLRLIPRVECQRLRSLDHRELIRAVKNCTTGPVQRRCQWKRNHHPPCCHLLSWWAGGSERGNPLKLVSVGRREPFLSSTSDALRAGCGSGSDLVTLGGTRRHG